MPRHRLVSSLVLCLVVSILSTAEAGSWSSFRGPKGSGEAIDSLPPGDGPLGLELAWKRDLGSGYSGISLAGDLLVTAFTDGELDLVIALNRATGEEIWRYELGPSYAGQDGSHDGPIATPAIADGRVFALDPSGRLAAIDLATGEERWTAHLVEDLGCEKPYYGFATSPAVTDGVVALQVGGEGGSVAGFDAASGQLRWRAVEDSVAAQSPIVGDVAGRRQFLVMGETKVAGIDPVSGGVLWELEHGGEGGPMGAMTQSPVPLGGNRIFVKHENPSSAVLELAEVDGAYAAYRVADSRGLTRSYSPATVAGDHLYGFTARLLSAVDPASGELLWRTRDVGDGFIISVGGHLAILQKKGTLHIGEASPQGWVESSALELFEDLAWTPPSYADGSLYVRSLGEIARVDLVRAESQLVASTQRTDLPAVLAPLAAAIAAGEDPATEVDRFLDGRSLPLVDGSTVVFLYRAEADDVAVAGDMIGMRREEPMHRLEGTDLWWWETELDPRARISYLFYDDLEPTVDPTNDRVIASTILGPDMNWQRDEPVEMSWFAMPEWPGRTAAVSAAARGGRLESIELTVQPSAPEGEEPPDPVQVPTDVWLPPGYDESDATYPVVYVLHRGALELGNWQETLDRVVGVSVEPLIAVFPDLPRMRGLRGSLQSQIVPQVDESFRTRADRESRAVVGMGFPGFTATMTAFAGSEVFGVLGVQSPFLTEGGMQEALRETVGEKTAETTPMRIYLEWGRWDLISPHEEMDFRAGAKWAWELLREAGYAPIGGEVWDSTDFASWANRTDLLLEALFPIDENPPSDLSAWQTASR